MKKTTFIPARLILALVMTLIALSAAAKNRIIKNPAVEYTPSWICVNEIEFANDATILRCELRNRPHWWVKVQGSTFLKDRDSERTWKFLKVEGVEQDKEIWMPDEGHVPCTLYFEPVAEDVKEVNLLEKDVRPESGVYGISLAPTMKTNSKTKTNTKTIDPREMTADYYMNQPFTPDTAWHFSHKHYDMLFYRPGKAHVEIQIDNLPRELREHFTSMSVSGEDQILRSKVTLSPTLNDNNRYVFDIDLAGPMSLSFIPFGDYFVQPGDTLEIFTTLESDPAQGGPRYTTFRSNSETAKINALRPKLMEKLIVKQGRSLNPSNLKAVEEGKESAEKQAGQCGAIAEYIITSEEARQTLINTPLSTFGKDLMMTYTLAEMGENIESVFMYYEDEYKQIREQDADGKVAWRENPDYVPLDKEKIYATMLRHRDLFYNNPLVLCTGWVFINRSLFGGLFRNYELVKSEDSNGENYYHREIDPFGMKGTFMYDLSNSQDFASCLGDLQQYVQLGKMQPTEALDGFSYSLAQSIVEISNPSVAKILLNEYRAVIARLEGGKKEADEDKWTAEQKTIWQKITAPYAGNLLFVDFWGMSCGPCRGGMMSMRDKVEALKNDAIRFLYVCDEKYSPRADAEKWMNENNIKGEHIYVTHDEWNQLEAMFNFTAIPHAVLANKSGKVIQNGFQIYQHSAEQLREMIGKF